MKLRAVGSHGFTACSESASTGAKFVKLSCVTDSVASTLNFIHSSRLAEILHVVYPMLSRNITIFLN